MKELDCIFKLKSISSIFFIKLKYIPEDWNLNSWTVLLKQKKKDCIALIKMHLIWAWLLSKCAPWGDFLLEISMKIFSAYFCKPYWWWRGGSMWDREYIAYLSSVVLDHSWKMNGYWNYHFWLWCCKWIHLSLLVWICPNRTAYRMDTYILIERIILPLLFCLIEPLKTLALG